MASTFLIWIQALLALSYLTTFTARAKAGPKGHAEPWDWQKAYPVFEQPYSKPEHALPDQPEFLPIARNVSVIVGETANLPCRVKNLFQHYTVSWIRARDVTVLSVGHLTFSSDQRLSVEEVPRPRLTASDWSLTILNVSKVDQGVYECQINTEPKINRKFYLSVQDDYRGSTQGDSPYYDVMLVDQAIPVSAYERTHSKLKKHQDLTDGDAGFPMWLHDNGCICPKPQFKKHSSSLSGKGPEMVITGGPVQYVSEGSGVGLECRVSGLTKPPRVLHWERRGKILTAKERPGLSLETERLAGISRASLYLSKSELGDTGNYTCVSDRVRTETVLLVVTLGYDDHPKGLKEAVFRNSASPISFSKFLQIFLFIFLLEAPIS